MILLGYVIDKDGTVIPVPENAEFSYKLFLEYGWAHVSNIVWRRIGHLKIGWKSGKMEFYPANKLGFYEPE